MSADRRAEVRAAFESGRCRCVVTTTALALGVNLPATHVLVRDAHFPGVGPVRVEDLLQMMGRAGRGDRPGHAVVLVRPTDPVDAGDLARALREERLAPLVSSFDRPTARPGQRHDEAADCAPQVLARLARRPETGQSAEELRTFFRRSLGGTSLAPLVVSALDFLSDPRRALAWDDEQHSFRPTALGLRASRSILPLPVAAGYARLLRDLLSVDPADELLGAWRLLDHLLALELLSGHSLPGSRFREALAGQVDTWMEEEPARAPVLYREWVAGGKDRSRAGEVLGSLGVGSPRRKDENEEGDRQAAYQALVRSILLFERGQGVEAADLERRWGLTGLGGVEERWRDDLLWLLAGLAAVLEVRCFYYHLREECGADAGRVRRVEGCLRRMRRQTFELQVHLKYCSPLGPVLRGLREVRGPGAGQAVGVETIRRLEAAGVRDPAALARLTPDQMARLGVRRDLARQLLTYARRSLARAEGAELDTGRRRRHHNEPAGGPQDDRGG